MSGIAYHITVIGFRVLLRVLHLLIPFLPAPPAPPQVEKMLGTCGLTPEQVADMNDKDWCFFLKHYRRRVPPCEQLLQRFDAAVEQFRSIVDFNLKEGAASSDREEGCQIAS